MSWEEKVRQSSVIRESHRETLISDLRDRPELTWIVGAPNRDTDRLQGDFFENFPVCYLDPAEKPIVKRQTVMVINNTCDLPTGRTEFVSVAPVFDVARLLEHKAKTKPEAVANFAKDLKKNQISELFYIPVLAGFPEGGLVRLDMACTVPASFLQEAVYRNTRKGSFTQNGFYVFS